MLKSRASRLAFVASLLYFSCWLLIILLSEGIDIAEVRTFLLFTSLTASIAIFLFGVSFAIAYSSYTAKKTQRLWLGAAWCLGLALTILSVFGLSIEVLDGYYISASDPRLSSVGPMRRVELERLVFGPDEIRFLFISLLPSVVIPIIALAVNWAMRTEDNSS